MEIKFNSTNNHPQFGAAKDLHLNYIVKKRANLLPERVLNRVNAYIAFETDGIPKFPTIRQLHNDTYEELMKATTLEEAKIMYPEFMEVGNLAELPYRFSRSKKLIEQQMPLENFALDCLKKIWSGTMVEDISKSYGFRTRDVFTNLCEHLNIPRPSKNYNTLLKASEEEGNQVIAEKTLQHLEQCKKNLAKAGDKHLEPEALTKQSESMRDVYRYNPEKRAQKSEIMRLTWHLCPEVKDAKKAFLAKQPQYVHQVISKAKQGKKLTEADNRIIATFNKMFWDTHPEMRIIYAEAKTMAEKMLRNEI